MQKLILALIFTLILIMIIVIFALNMTKEDMTKPYHISKEISKSGSSSKGAPAQLGLQELERPKEPPAETVKEQEPVRREKTPEYNLDEIPDKELEAIEAKGEEEEAVQEGDANDKRLNTRPPAKKLRELKVRGAVIY